MFVLIVLGFAVCLVEHTVLVSLVELSAIDLICHIFEQIPALLEALRVELQNELQIES